MLSVLCTPALIIEEYKLETFLEVALLEPDVTFMILLILLFLSPGLILSGLYPKKYFY